MSSRLVAEPVATAGRMTAVEPAAAVAYPGPWGPVQIAATSRGTASEVAERIWENWRRNAFGHWVGQMIRQHQIETHPERIPND